MEIEIDTPIGRLQATTEFVRRALRDFGLMEAFENRQILEQAVCLDWVNATDDERLQEDRVSRILDCLAAGASLRSIYDGEAGDASVKLQPATT
jgi:hypothetical protein